MRLGAAVAMTALSLGATACGSSPKQDAKEPTGRYPVQVASASFPPRQRLSEHTVMRLDVRNSGSRVIPDIAVTVKAKGEGTGTQAFQESGTPAQQQTNNLANPSRPIWVLDGGPQSSGKAEGFDHPSGQPNTAYANTWSLGPLAPNKTAVFLWKVTATRPGSHSLTWEVNAGLNGKAVADASGGGRPRGGFTVFIDRRPIKEGVGAGGRKILLPSG